MYIRVKKVNGYKYAYLVKSVWDAEKKSVKQEVIRYLGNLSNPKRISKINLSKLSDKELEIIQTYIDGIVTNPPKINAWKSVCPECSMKKSPQAKRCMNCSTKKKFHGWCTSELRERFLSKEIV